MIKPTIGRVVWYWPGEDDLNSVGMVQRKDDQPFDAHIVFVWSDTCVNLIVFDHAGDDWRRQSVSINSETHPQGEGHAEWMPYQKRR